MIGLPRVKNQGLPGWQRDALPLSYAHIFKATLSRFLIQSIQINNRYDILFKNYEKK